MAMSHKVSRTKMLVFHAIVTLFAICVCVVAWMMLDNQKADAQLTGVFC